MCLYMYFPNVKYAREKFHMSGFWCLLRFLRDKNDLDELDSCITSMYIDFQVKGKILPYFEIKS